MVSDGVEDDTHNLHISLILGDVYPREAGQQEVKNIIRCGDGVRQYYNQFGFFKNKFIYFLFILFLAALGLRCCVRAFSSCCEQGLLFIAARRLLIVVASLVAELRL